MEGQHPYPEQARLITQIPPWVFQPQDKVWCPPSRPARGIPGPSFCLCLLGRPGLPGELGAAHHCLGARGCLHLLQEAAAAPDDGAQQQGGDQWVQRQ